jgi:alcohol dehydrogenase class IV
MRFEFATAARIVYGSGTVSELPKIVREFGTRALIVTGRNSDRAASQVLALQAATVDCTLISIEVEPTVDMVREGAAKARQDSRDVVIGIGGGSAIDAAKAIAIVATNSGEPVDYLEVVGKGRQFAATPLPFIAVPTTAGTGAEVTRNAVLGSLEHQGKASLRSPAMLAKAAIVDPVLTLDVPPHVTASTGLDTLTQLIEPYVSSRANQFTDMFCREGMHRVREALPRVFQNSGDRESRAAMSFASLLSGLSLANAGLGVVHGFASPLGGMLSAPHGAICAAVLPHGVAVNIAALRARGPQHALDKYAEAARILTDHPHAQAADLITWLEDLGNRLEIRGLGALGLTSTQIPELVEKAAIASSMRANPVVLTPDELTDIAQRSM